MLFAPDPLDPGSFNQFSINVDENGVSGQLSGSIDTMRVVPLPVPLTMFAGALALLGVWCRRPERPRR